MSLSVPNPHNKRMRTIVFAIYNKLGPNNGHSGCQPGSPYPKFHSLFTISRDSKLFFGVIIYSKGLDSFNETSMIELSQGKAAEIFSLARIINKLSVIVIRLENEQRFQVKHVMNQIFDCIGHSKASHSIK